MQHFDTSLVLINSDKSQTSEPINAINLSVYKIIKCHATF